MRWIKASERLPEKDAKYYVRYIETGTKNWIWLRYIQESKYSYEWLDESEEQNPDPLPEDIDGFINQLGCSPFDREQLKDIVIKPLQEENKSLREENERLKEQLSVYTDDNWYDEKYVNELLRTAGNAQDTLIKEIERLRGLIESENNSRLFK